MKKLSRVNDFVIRFANINGSGSASANNMFAKAVFRMGVPVSPKNIFPSNIQGLPTWYEVRISEKGYQARRGGYDFLVAMNGQTLEQDYMDLAAGGYFLYDDTRPLPETCQREDVTLLPIPLTVIANREIKIAKLRSLLKNIIYIGALAALFDMGLEVFIEAIKKQFSKKPALAEPNILALEAGFNYARSHFKDLCNLSVRESDLVGNKILIDGNTATGLGAIYGGATVAGWYPITPSTSVVEAFDKFTKKLRMDENGQCRAAVIQAEDELAALGIAVGAGWNGARAFTATSGPGISLMNELLGLAYFTEIPVVVVDVQRAGPSTGMPTKTQQSDVLACAHASHGDTRHVLLFPFNPKECFEMTAGAFELAEALQTPVIVMSDLDLGMNDHMCDPFDWDDDAVYNRGKLLSAEQLEALGDDWAKKWGRYLDTDSDGACYRTLPGTHPDRGAYFTRGSSHNEYAAYTEDNAIYKKGMERLVRKWETAGTLVPGPEITIHDPKADCALIFFGTTTPAAMEAVDLLAELNIRPNTMRIKAFPFNTEVAAFIDRHETVFLAEQNRDGQMRMLLINELDILPGKLISIAHMDATPPDAASISRAIQGGAA